MSKGLETRKYTYEDSQNQTQKVEIFFKHGYFAGTRIPFTKGFSMKEWRILGQIAAEIDKHSRKPCQPWPECDDGWWTLVDNSEPLKQ